MQSLQSLSSWSHVTTGDVPRPLVGPSITLCPLARPYPPTVFLFGGRLVHTRRMTADMYALNLDTMIWTKVGSPGSGDSPGSRDNDIDPVREAAPQARYFHSMDVWQDKLVMFGGMTDTDSLTVLSDVWIFDCTTRQWLPQASPSIGIGLGIESVPEVRQDAAMLPQARYAHLSSVSRGKLLIVGGQHVDNSYVYEINVFDLESKVWVSKTPQPVVQEQNSKGAYRAVAVSGPYKVVQPESAFGLSYTVEEDGGGGDIVCYSNYEFANVRRELELLSPVTPGAFVTPIGPSAFHPPPSFTVREMTSQMRGSSLPPGLRFPTGGILGSHLILSGLYLASSTQSFSVWALNLDTLIWKRLETHALTKGSWNRAVIQPETARLLVFGNMQANLAEDYGRRAINVDHVSVISLETFGIYQPPRMEVPTSVQEIGLTTLEEKLISDFEVVCDDGRKIRCSREILRRRWPWFAEEEKSVTDKAVQALRDLGASSTPATPASTFGPDIQTSFIPARLTPRQLHLPEPFPICVAFVQYLYTLSLATPLQLKSPVLSSLLFLAKQYKLERLSKLVVHALHERLDRSIALGVYEIATLCGEKELQVRALKIVVSAKNHARTASTSSHHRGPSAAFLPTPPGQGEAYHGGRRATGPSTGGYSGGFTAPYPSQNPVLQMASLNIDDGDLSQSVGPNLPRRESETLPSFEDAERASPETPLAASGPTNHGLTARPLTSPRSMTSLQPKASTIFTIRHARSHDLLRSAGKVPKAFHLLGSPAIPPMDAVNTSDLHLGRQGLGSPLGHANRITLPSAGLKSEARQMETPSPSFSEHQSTTTITSLLTPSDSSAVQRDAPPASEHYFQSRSNPRLSSLLESPECSQPAAAFDFPSPPSRDDCRRGSSNLSPALSVFQMATDQPIHSRPNTTDSQRLSSDDWLDTKRTSDSLSTGAHSYCAKSPSLSSMKSEHTFGHDFGTLTMRTRGNLPFISDEYNVTIGPVSGAKRVSSHGEMVRSHSPWGRSDSRRNSETASIMTSSTSSSSMLNTLTVKHMAKIEKAEAKAAEQRARQTQIQQEARARMLEFGSRKRSNEAELSKGKNASSTASSASNGSNKAGSMKTKKTNKFAALLKAAIDAAGPTGVPM